MPTHVKCPSCSTILQLPTAVPPGGAVRCLKCTTILRLPSQTPPVVPTSSPAAKFSGLAAPTAKPSMLTAPLVKSPAPPPLSKAIKPTASKAPPQTPITNELISDDEEDNKTRRSKGKPKSTKGLTIGLLASVAVLVLTCGSLASYGIYRLAHDVKEIDKRFAEEKKKLDKQPQPDKNPPTKNKVDLSPELRGASISWKSFVSQQGRFSVQFLGAPRETSKKDCQGEVTFTFHVELQGGKVSYMVMYKDMAASSQLSLDAIAKSFGPAVKNKKKIKLDGHAGMELELELEQGHETVVITDRIYLVEQRMYQVMASATKDKKDPIQFTKFLDSFKLRKID